MHACTHTPPPHSPKYSILFHSSSFKKRAPEGRVRLFEAGVGLVHPLPHRGEDALPVARVHVQEDVHHCFCGVFVVCFCSCTGGFPSLCDVLLVCFPQGWRRMEGMTD